MGRLSSCCSCPCPRTRPRASCWRLGTRPSRGAVEPSPTRESRPSRGGLATTACPKIGVSPLPAQPLRPANALLVCLTADRFVCCDPQPEPAPQPAFAPAPAPDYSYDYGDDDDGPVADDV